MVSIHPQKGERFFLQSFQMISFICTVIPQATKVPANNDIVISRHGFLFPKDLRSKSSEITMCISGNEYHRITPFLRIAPPRYPRAGR